jgi:hypothetical protein
LLSRVSEKGTRRHLTRSDSRNSNVRLPRYSPSRSDPYVGRKEAKARGERYTSPVEVPSEESDELIIVDKPKPKAKGKAQAREDPDDEESEGAWTVEDEGEMDGFIDDADKNDDDHDEISNLLPGMSLQPLRKAV